MLQSVFQLLTPLSHPLLSLRVLDRDTFRTVCPCALQSVPWPGNFPRFGCQQEPEPTLSPCRTLPYATLSPSRPESKTPHLTVSLTSLLTHSLAFRASHQRALFGLILISKYRVHTCQSTALEPSFVLSSLSRLPFVPISTLRSPAHPHRQSTCPCFSTRPQPAPFPPHGRDLCTVPCEPGGRRGGALKRKS